MFFYLTVRCCYIESIKKNFSELLLIVSRQISWMKRYFSAHVSLDKNIMKYGFDIHEMILENEGYFFGFSQRINSESIFTPHPVAPFGIYPQFVSR